MSLFPSIDVFLQVVINGLLLGCMYGVAAIGLSLIFGCMQIIFIAQGAIMILAAYCIYWLYTLTPINPLFGFLLIIPVFWGVGWLIYKGMFQRVAKVGQSPTLLLAFGLMILLENLMLYFWSPDVRSVKTIFSSSAIGIGDVNISVTRLIVAAVALISTAIVFLFLKKTMVGKAVRGVSEDKTTGMLLGISSAKVSAITFAIGIAMAGVAGAATSIIYPFDPYFGFSFSLKALIAVAFGGLGNVGGALLGGLILGLLESLSSYTISPGWADAVSYAAFLLVLILRPQGLLGRAFEKF
ncbi:MAG: branched-chain amino acid ABC transporter permease [Spirochaetes bacterium]|nr:branched-chain amino acid ABC transporter permease [Spirochaetota bacterium]